MNIAKALPADTITGSNRELGIYTINTATLESAGLGSSSYHAR